MKTFTKVAGAAAIAGSLSGCANTAYMDPNVAAIAGGALLGAVANAATSGSSFQGPATVAATAIGAGMSSAYVNEQRKCSTDTRLTRQAQQNNSTGVRTVDVTNQAVVQNCTLYGSTPSGSTAVAPIFKDNTGPNVTREEFVTELLAKSKPPAPNVPSM